MNHYDTASRLIASRQGLADGLSLPRRNLLQALVQMSNRGNGKGGGAALVGLDPAQFGVTPEILRDDYLLTIAYLDPSARAEVEGQFVEPVFTVDHNYQFPINN